VKGGRLAALTQPAEMVTLILSDVVGNALDVIGSGPTVPDRSTFADAHDVLARCGALSRTPAAVVGRLKDGMAGRLPETPKPGDPAFRHAHTVLLADNRQSAEAAVSEARALGFHALLLTASVQGEAREIGSFLAALAREEADAEGPAVRPAFLVVGGETTVTLRGKGRGGRNQEMALSAALGIEGLSGTLIACLSTDGSDGPTDAAGALADGDTVGRARERGMRAAAYLQDNDSYAFFDQLGDLVRTGPTNTNVNDLAFVLVQ
jgi:glycerate 2-kinase